mgnify:FL=1
MREKLLRTGMGCFAFAAGIGAVNALLLPYARAYYGFGFWPMLAAYAAALFLFWAVGRAVRGMREASAERIARVLAPTFIACLFAAHLRMG